MHIELRHLRTIMAINAAGSVAQAAEQLHITQSALSHQLRAIREQLGVDLFVKNTKPMRLSAEGMRFLRAAERILPEIDQLKAEFDSLQKGQAGRLHIAIECHACFEWLFPVLNLFRIDFPDVDIDIRPGLAFRALSALADEEVDVVISSDPEAIAGVEFHQLFPYSPTFLAAANNPLVEKPFIDAMDFLDQTLITYPVERTRLDIFSQLLIPARVEPKLVRQVELTAVMLMLVGANKGVTVLPDWVIRSADIDAGLVARPVTRNGLTRQLYAAVRQDD
ncbi:MAG: LysR family transcriptional regulator, partial [Opitutae bacterium]